MPQVFLERSVAWSGSRSLVHAPNSYLTAADVVTRTLRLLLGLPVFFGIVRGMLGRILFIATVIAAIVLGVIFQLTTPAAIGPVGVLLVFVLMYVFALGILTLLIFSISQFLQKSINMLIAARRPFSSLSLTRSYYFSSVLALAPVMLIAIHSVGELGFYDVLLVVIFILISCIYVTKRTR